MTKLRVRGEVKGERGARSHRGRRDGADKWHQAKPPHSELLSGRLTGSSPLTICRPLSPICVARKQEIIKITEQLIEAINNGDFDAYT